MLGRLTVELLVAMVLGGLAFRCLRICLSMAIPLTLLGAAVVTMPATIGAMSMVEIQTPIALQPPLPPEFIATASGDFSVLPAARSLGPLGRLG